MMSYSTRHHRWSHWRNCSRYGPPQTKTKNTSYSL